MGGGIKDLQAALRAAYDPYTPAMSRREAAHVASMTASRLNFDLHGVRLEEDALRAGFTPEQACVWESLEVSLDRAGAAGLVRNAAPYDYSLERARNLISLAGNFAPRAPRLARALRFLARVLQASAWMQTAAFDAAVRHGRVALSPRAWPQTVGPGVSVAYVQDDSGRNSHQGQGGRSRKSRAVLVAPPPAAPSATDAAGSEEAPPGSLAALVATDKYATKQTK